MPGETNIIVRYYIDWFDQLLSCISYYTMMCTIALFFMGMCIYIGGMVENIKQTLAEIEEDSDSMAQRLSTEIAFHNQLLE